MNTNKGANYMRIKFAGLFVGMLLVGASLSAAVRVSTSTDASVSYGERSNSVVKTIWSGLLNTDTGSPAVFPENADRSIQCTGTFGAGGTIVIEGSNDGTNYSTLTDQLGSSLSMTAAGIKMITELTFYIRPRVSAGDGTTNLTCTMLFKKVR